MSNQQWDSVPIRVVRDESQGMYLLQIVVDGVARTFHGMKLGKLDQLLAEAKANPPQPPTPAA